MIRGHHLNKSRRRLLNGLRQSALRSYSVSFVHVDSVRGKHLAEWRALGELGQYLAGLAAGYTPHEIKVSRGWSDAEYCDIVARAAEHIGHNAGDLFARLAPKKERHHDTR